MVAVRRASIPSEQLDCRVAAQLDLPAQRAQVALPEGVPRGYHESKIYPQRAPDDGGAKAA